MSVRITALLVLLVAALTLAGSGGAAAASQPPKIDLSSPSAIDTYLQSIGVDPAKVVKQVGLKNYAGPSCPGVGWNCTTAALVVQVTTAGGENGFQCSSSNVTGGVSNPPDECVVVQVGPTNQAHCIENDSDPAAQQTCSITQSGANNHAFVDQSIDTSTSSTPPGTVTQSNSQTADVTQQPQTTESPNNASQVHQFIKQSLTFDTTQVQDAFQQAFVVQNGNGSDNFSHVHQGQDQNESGNAMVQNQNTTPEPAFNCGFEKPGNPNQCANVDQGAKPDGGNNTSHIHQAAGERQTSTNTSVQQTQGRFDGGQEGDVHQDNPTNAGSNEDHAHQDLRQRQSSPTGVAPTQKQVTDPGCCGVGTQVGGIKNTEDINQSTTQSASQSTAVQNSTLFGEVHQESGGGFLSSPATTATPSNSCTIDQFGRNNGGGDHFSADGNTAITCATLTLATACQYPSEGPSCFPTEVNCEQPPCEELLTTIPTTATFGQDIAMPDYTAEPSDYVPPAG
jgi:hypothetical protein